MKKINKKSEDEDEVVGEDAFLLSKSTSAHDAETFKVVFLCPSHERTNKGCDVKTSQKALFSFFVCVDGEVDRESQTTNTRPMG